MYSWLITKERFLISRSKEATKSSCSILFRDSNTMIA
ncbi:hypothetical protein NC652_016643 [Populus alba x Populus x berolinensis]|uniref:Uncharacterized protein n=1 Tax=Populus alba x Populus x berolinensis TaxID=444605 RepID=A0AAD6QN30_9ROSI|nr:hypothetical protein NC652_016643 [Populus alba x Populus x berolinensis]KAJ6993475.1 hypothetical protein NC653_016570 [Populus alba x Populus x berolinensis]